MAVEKIKCLMIGALNEVFSKNTYINAQKAKPS